MASLHDVRFPGETDEYRRARDELLEAEIDLRRRIEGVAAQRRELPVGGEIVTDYPFDEWDPAADESREVKLSELFDDGKDTLFLYSFMFVPREQGLPFVGPCPTCTSIIDGIDGELPHITQRVNFAVASKGPIERFREHGRSRGWRHARLLSSANSSYNVDYQAEDSDGNQWPLATVFVRRDGRIHHYWSSELWFVSRGETARTRGTSISCGLCGRSWTAVRTVGASSCRRSSIRRRTAHRHRSREGGLVVRAVWW